LSADDRGGRPEDYENYVTLLKEMRAAFDEINPGWGITMAIPASYWYLQHFDVGEMQKYVDWFNLMRYLSLYPLLLSDRARIAD
jgi:GH18 family chitinase